MSGHQPIEAILMKHAEMGGEHLAIHTQRRHVRAPVRNPRMPQSTVELLAMETPRRSRTQPPQALQLTPLPPCVREIAPAAGCGEGGERGRQRSGRVGVVRMARMLLRNYWIGGTVRECLRPEFNSAFRNTLPYQEVAGVQKGLSTTPQGGGPIRAGRAWDRRRGCSAAALRRRPGRAFPSRRSPACAG